MGRRHKRKKKDKKTDNTYSELYSDMDGTFAFIAGYTSGGKMTGCQVIEDVTGVTERALTVSGDTFNVFFLKPGTCAPLSVCAEL